MTAWSWLSGRNSIRQAKLDQLRGWWGRLFSLVHPDTTLSRYAVLEDGSVVFIGAVVNADANIADGAILNKGCSIDHDCLLGSCIDVSARLGSLAVYV